MPSRGFPAPPDLSELLKFFESDEGKARVSRQSGATNRRSLSQSSFSKRLSSGNLQAATSKVWGAPKPASVGTAEGCRLSQSRTTTIEHKPLRDEKPSAALQGWNSSTQLPPAPTKALRHQLLCRAYQPPAPVYVVPSEASELLDRLSKGTISSRSKLKLQDDSTRGGQKVVSNDRSSSGIGLHQPRIPVVEMLFRLCCFTGRRSKRGAAWTQMTRELTNNNQKYC
ncbi:hypothetical protein GQ600_14591 [Phytophthora cactorum]|nr:hypothetical protein GQ600_14591 [Phytophthora cactorum]